MVSKTTFTYDDAGETFQWDLKQMQLNAQQVLYTAKDTLIKHFNMATAQS